MLAVAAIPATVRRQPEALAPIAWGAGLSLAAIVGGYWLAQIVFRGPDPFATKLVVGGFVIRLSLLFFLTAVAVTTIGLDLASFVLWLVGFYFVLIVVEAWLLGRPAPERAP